jgi:hypothetical protein
MLRTLASPDRTTELLAGWPDWAVVIVTVVAVALAIWVLGKLLKLALWLVVVAVVVAAGVAAAGLLLRW